VLSFCENIERHHIKRQEMTIHVFYFLCQLFQYLKSPDDFSATSSEVDPKGKKLGIFSKANIDLRDFFMKILPDVSNFLKELFKDANIEDKVKAAKLPDEALKPFREKASLVFLSVANSVTKEKLRVILFSEPKKLTAFIKNLKKLSNKISFAEPYSTFFEKKKIQVFRKLVEAMVGIFMDAQDPSTFGPEYHQSIYQCRVLIIFFWNKLAKIKQDYKSTVRSKNMVKDQLKVHKGKMLETFCAYWQKFCHTG